MAEQRNVHGAPAKCVPVGRKRGEAVRPIRREPRLLFFLRPARVTSNVIGSSLDPKWRLRQGQ